MTKKELIEENVRLSALVFTQQIDLGVARERAKRAEDLLSDLRSMDPGKRAGLQVYIAHSDEDQPLCIAGSDDGLAVDVFYDSGSVTGVLISRGADYVAGAGMVPYSLAKYVVEE